MRARWQWLHSDLMGSASRDRFQSEFSQLCARHDVLHRLRDPAALLEALHGPGGDPESRNTMLRALVAVAQEVGGQSQVATTLLLLALWPGLDAVHARLCRDFPQERDEMGLEITGRVAVGVAKLKLGKVRRIAATLIMNTERDIRRNIVGIIKRRIREVPIDGEVGLQLASPADPDLGHGAAAAWRRLLVPLIGRDAELLVRIIVLGETQHEAGLALGLSPEASRKRHQRALQKLEKLQHAPAQLSHLDAPAGF